MRHLIIGASGQIGESLLRTLNKNQEETIATFHKTPLWGSNNPEGFTENILPGKIFKLDITNQKEVERLIADNNPDIIYIAVQTSAKYCEEYPNESAQININGICNIVQSVNNIIYQFDAKRKPLIVFYSNDYIFDGTSGPYNEENIPSPCSIFGRQKLDAEHYVSTNAKNYLIIRTTNIFGHLNNKNNNNFVINIINDLKQNKTVYAEDNIFISPTYINDLASASIKIAKNKTDNVNLVHIAGSDIVSKYEFANEVARVMGFRKELVKPIQNKTTIKSGFCILKAEKLVGRRLLNYHDGLEKMKRILI